MNETPAPAPRVRMTPSNGNYKEYYTERRVVIDQLMAVQKLKVCTPLHKQLFCYYNKDPTDDNHAVVVYNNPSIFAVVSRRQSHSSRKVHFRRKGAYTLELRDGNWSHLRLLQGRSVEKSAHKPIPAWKYIAGLLKKMKNNMMTRIS